MDVSIFLAKALGLYLITLSVTLIFFTETLTSIFSGIFHNASLQYVLGFYLLVLGILMVVSHNRWEASWIVTITILGWLTLTKGVLYTVFPKLVNEWSKSAVHSKLLLRFSGVLLLLTGGFLCYMGFVVG